MTTTTASDSTTTTRIVNGRVFHVTRIATARDTNTRYTPRDHVALVRAGRRVDRDAWLDERPACNAHILFDGEE